MLITQLKFSIYFFWNKLKYKTPQSKFSIAVQSAPTIPEQTKPLSNPPQNPPPHSKAMRGR